AIERGLELSRRSGIRHYESEFLAASTDYLVFRGRWDEARARAEEVAQLGLEDESMWDLGLHTTMLEVAARRGDVPAARDHLDGLPPMQESDALERRTTYAVSETMLAATEGRHRDALDIARAAMATSMGPLGGLSNGAIRQLAIEALRAALTLGDVSMAEE